MTTQTCPIFDLGTIRTILTKFLNIKEYRAYLLLKVGINTPLTLTELLNLQVKDINHGRVKLYLSNQLPKEVTEYLASLPEEEKLFTFEDYDVVKLTAVQVGVRDFGEETMRQTFGYQYFQKTKDIRKVERALQMKPETVTFKYIGYHDERYFCFYCTKGCLW